MSNSKDIANEQDSESGEKKRRPRSMTLLNVQWWAERVKKAENICKQLKDGTYSVDPEKVAKSIVSR